MLKCVQLKNINIFCWLNINSLIVLWCLLHGHIKHEKLNVDWSMQDMIFSLNWILWVYNYQQSGTSRNITASWAWIFLTSFKEKCAQWFNYCYICILKYVCHIQQKILNQVLRQPAHHHHTGATSARFGVLGIFFRNNVRVSKHFTR